MESWGRGGWQVAGGARHLRPVCSELVRGWGGLAGRPRVHGECVYVCVLLMMI